MLKDVYKIGIYFFFEDILHKLGIITVHEIAEYQEVVKWVEKCTNNEFKRYRHDIKRFS